MTPSAVLIVGPYHERDRAGNDSQLVACVARRDLREALGPARGSVEPSCHRAALLSSRPLRYRPAVTPTDEDEDIPTDAHMRFLGWLATHPSRSPTTAAQALDLAVGEVEILSADLVAAGIVHRVRLQ